MASIRLYTTPDEAGGLDVVMVAPYACANGLSGEVFLTLSPAQARDLGALLVDRAGAIQRTEVGPGLTTKALLKRISQLEAELRDDHWPHGATVKLVWAGPGHQDRAGWAKRNERGELVSVYSGLELDASVWEVLEERADGRP